MRTCNCPNCSAGLNFGDDREFLFCEYCGTKIMTDDKRIRINQVITNITRDETKIREAEEKTKQDTAELKLAALMFVILAVLGLICCILGSITS